MKLIVALDFDNQHEALTLVDKLCPDKCVLKVGLEMFTLYGRAFVRKLVALKFKVFLDLKFYDIPNTVARACAASADLGVWMMNVHALGGPSMMTAAREALVFAGVERPLLIGVTVLTSMNTTEFAKIGIQASISSTVSNLAKLTKEAGLDGVVCSAHEVGFIKSECGPHFLTITPGIRLQDTQDDQSRVMTPAQAFKEGSDYIVVGRPITRAKDPMQVVREILQDV